MRVHLLMLIGEIFLVVASLLGWTSTLDSLEATRPNWRWKKKLGKYWGNGRTLIVIINFFYLYEKPCLKMIVPLVQSKQGGGGGGGGNLSVTKNRNFNFCYTKSLWEVNHLAHLAATNFATKKIFVALLAIATKKTTLPQKSPASRVHVVRDKE